MTARDQVRNDRIATRYLFGENAKQLARANGIGITRIRQILRSHLEHSRREFYRHFGRWPDDLGTDALRPRLLHLMNQFRVETDEAPLSPKVLIRKGRGKNSDGPQWRGGAGPLNGEAAASPCEAAES